MLKTFIFFIAAALTFAGCTREESPRRQHVSEVISAPEQTAAPTNVNAALGPSADLVARIKARLERKLLDAEVRKQSPSERKSLYDSMVEAATFVTAAPTQDPVRLDILKTFESVVTDGCSERLDGCRYLSLFKSNSGAVTLLLAIADDQAIDIEKRYRMLKLAFASVSQIDDERVSIAYIKTARAYEEKLRTKSDRASLLALEQHQEIFDISFTKLKNSMNVDERTALLNGLEKSFDIWNFGRARNAESAAREETLLSLTADRFFANDSILRAQLVELNKNPNSASSKLQKVRAASLKAFGLKQNLPEDVHTFLFDSIWTDRLTVAEASILWTAYSNKLGSSSDSSTARTRAREELLNYARTRMLVSANDANAVLTTFFSAKGKFVTANAFQDGIKESVRGETIWADAKKRLETLRSFNDRNLRSAKTDDPLNQELDGFFASINRNIKLISTYPSMLVMTYHLARLNYSMKIRTWTGDFTIESGQILDWFFEGALEPWMAYGDDYRRLTKSEITTVFYYALEMGVLSEGGVNIEHLFKMLTEQMAGPIRLEVERMGDAYRKIFENSPIAGEFHRLCAQVQQKAKAGEPLLVSTPIDLVNLPLYTILGIPEGLGTIKFIHPIFHAGWGFFESETTITKNRLDENLEIIRLELTPKIDRMRLLARLSDDYLQRHGIAEREKIMSEIHSRIQPLEAVRKRFYSHAFKLVKSNGACGENLIQYELASQLHVIKGLASHFREVHAAMKASRMTAINPEALERKFGFNGKVDLGEMANHETGLGYNSEMYRVSRLQTLLRIKSLLENGFTDGTVFHGPRRTKKSIMLPARLRDIPSSLRDEVLRLDWNDDADEFVTNGIQQIFDPNIGNVMWSSLNTFALSIHVKIRGMSALVKAGTVQTDDGPQRMEPREVMRMALDMSKWIEIEGTEWMNVLTITGEFTRVRLASMLDKYAWEGSSRTWMGSLDFVFKAIRSDKLGAGEGSEGDATGARYGRRDGPRREFVTHSQVVKAYGQPALKIADSALTEITEFYRRGLDAQMILVAETLEEVARLEPLKAASPQNFPSWRLYSSRPAPKIPLLSESELEAFRLETFELVRQSQYVIPERTTKAMKR